MPMSIPTLVTRWLYGHGKHESVVTPDFYNDRIVTFRDLIQVLAIKDLRRQYKIPLQKIREAVKEFKTRYRLSHPFIQKHTIYLYNKNIYIYMDNDYVQASGGGIGQVAITKIVEPYVIDLHFNIKGIADYYVPLEKQFNGTLKRIVLNPKWHFGEPCVEPCGFTAQTLYDASKSEGSKEAAADAYDVEVEDVDIACKYIVSLLPRHEDKVAA